MRISNPQKDCLIVGFDSAWTDKAGSPGAIAALGFDPDGTSSFFKPELVSFDEAAAWIEERKKNYSLCIVAIDQPTIVPNDQGMRKAEKVAGSVISFIGGGVQPANRSKKTMFGDDAPIWRFLELLHGHSKLIDQSRNEQKGLFIIEVFPALSLPAFNSEFYQSKSAPKYNPGNRKKFNINDWEAVLKTVRHKSDELNLTHLAKWVDELMEISDPKKRDQDRLDAAICALIGFIWRACSVDSAICIGDEQAGYIISATNPNMTRRLLDKATEIGVTTSIQR